MSDDKKFGEYEVIGVLGKGAQGKVYKVRWINDRWGETFGALKLLNSSKFRKVLAEVSTWARVSQHPNILTFITASEDRNRFFIISEIANDGDLTKWIKNKGGKEEFFEESLEIMQGVLEGLEHLHKNDVIHRDVKPENILLNDGIPLLADFGLARSLNFRQSNILAGTRGFLSPELIQSFLNDNQSKYERTEMDDLWAVAKTFQSMWTGRDSSNPLPINISEDITVFFEKAFAKDVGDRFRTAKEMREALIRDVLFLEKKTITDKNFQNQGGFTSEPTADFRNNKSKDEPTKPKSKPKTKKNYSAWIFGSLSAILLLVIGIIGISIWVNQNSSSLSKNDKSPINNDINVSEKANINTNSSKTAKDYFDLGLACKETDYDCQVENYTKAIKLKSEYSEAYVNRGVAHYDNYDYDRAIKDYNKAIELKPNVADSYNRRGNAHFERIEYDRAINDYNKAIELDPDFVNPYFNLGNTYRNKKNYNQAIKNYNKAIDLDSNYSKAYFGRGYIYDLKNNLDLAIRDYNKTLELNPDYTDAYINRGVAYYNKNKYDRAIQNYNKAIKLNPKSMLAYFNRGAAYDDKGEYDSAIRDYDKAIELNSNYVDAYVYRGIIYRKKGEYDLAIKSYDKAIELDPNSAWAYNARGSAYNHKEEYDKAIADFKKALQIKPDYKLAKENLEIALNNRD